MVIMQNLKKYLLVEQRKYISNILFQVLLGSTTSLNSSSSFNHSFSKRYGEQRSSIVTVEENASSTKYNGVEQRTKDNKNSSVEHIYDENFKPKSRVQFHVGDRPHSALPPISSN